LLPVYHSVVTIGYDSCSEEVRLGGAFLRLRNLKEVFGRLGERTGLERCGDERLDD
jgi:hypothetical protein